MGSPRARLALSWLAGFTLIDSSIVSLALADIGREFDRPVGALAWVSTGYLLALAATLLAAGRLTDRLGPRRVIVGGAVAFLVLTAACGVAPTFELLVAARIAQGIAGGVLYTVSLAIVVTAFPPERRATALSIYFTSGALGAVIGPALGGLLTDLGGWRLVFLAQLPLPAAVALLGLAVLPAAPGRAGRFDVPGLVAGSLFVLATVFGVLQLPVPGAGPTVAVAALVAAGALLVFVVVERRSADPAVRLEIFRNGRFVTASVAGASAWFGIMSSVVFSALYLQLGRQLDATTAGLLLLASPAVALAFFPFGGRVVRALGVDRATGFGLVLQAGSAAAMTTWGAGTPLWFVVLTSLFVGAGIAITLVASATDALAQFTPAEAGTGSALFNSIRQLGAALGVALPAVAFELVAAGARTPDAALGGSTAAFVLRFVVLLVPLALLAARLRPVAREAEPRAI